MRDKVYGPREVEEKLGVAPSKVRDYLALTGDTSDNVPGVPSIQTQDGHRPLARVPIARWRLRTRG